LAASRVAEKEAGVESKGLKKYESLKRDSFYFLQRTLEKRADEIAILKAAMNSTGGTPLGSKSSMRRRFREPPDRSVASTPTSASPAQSFGRGYTRSLRRGAADSVESGIESGISDSAYNYRSLSRSYVDSNTNRSGSGYSDIYPYNSEVVMERSVSRITKRDWAGSEMDHFDTFSR